MKNLTKKDKEVIRAFLEGKESQSKKFTSTGKTLDGSWLGGSNIGYTKDRQKKFRPTTSKADEKIKNYVRRLMNK